MKTVCLAILSAMLIAGQFVFAANASQKKLAETVKKQMAAEQKAHAERINKINNSKTIAEQIKIAGFKKDVAEFFLKKAKEFGIKVLPKATVSGNTLKVKGRGPKEYTLVAVEPIVGKFSLNGYVFQMKPKLKMQERFDYMSRIIQKVSAQKSAGLFQWISRAEADDSEWLNADTYTMSGFFTDWFRDQNMQDTMNNLNEKFDHNHRAELKCRGRGQDGQLHIVTRNNSKQKVAHLIDFSVSFPGCNAKMAKDCENQKALAAKNYLYVKVTTDVGEEEFAVQRSLGFQSDLYTDAGERMSFISGRSACAADGTNCDPVNDADVPGTALLAAQDRFMDDKQDLGG